MYLHCILPQWTCRPAACDKHCVSRPELCGQIPFIQCVVCPRIVILNCYALLLIIIIIMLSSQKLKESFRSTLIASGLSNPHQLSNLVNRILRHSSSPVQPFHDSLSSLSQSLAAFFSNVTNSKLHTSLPSNYARTSPHIPPLLTQPNFLSFSFFATA
jgi:hypothetical protein